MTNATEFAKANETYAKDFGVKSDLAMPPSRKVAVITCMDARIDPAASLGIKEGEAHIIRNAGGRAHDALRSVIISQHLLGTNEVVVFHHTDCGMLTFQDPGLRDKLRESVSPNIKDAIAPVIDNFSFLPFSDVDRSVREDVAYLQQHPLVADKSKITGWVYDVKTGKVNQVV